MLFAAGVADFGVTKIDDEDARTLVDADFLLFDANGVRWSLVLESTVWC